MGVVLVGVEAITRPLVRCAIYEKLYIQSVPGLLISQNLKAVLEELYS